MLAKYFSIIRNYVLSVSSQRKYNFYHQNTLLDDLRTNSRYIIDRNPSMVIPLLANQDLTPMFVYSEDTIANDFFLKENSIVCNSLFSRLKSDRKRQEKLAKVRLTERRNRRNQAKKTTVAQRELEDTDDPKKLQVCICCAIGFSLIFYYSYKVFYM